MDGLNPIWGVMPMSMEHFTDKALSEWMKGQGPYSEIVISSRVRIARNLRSYPFPMLADQVQSAEVLDKAADVLDNEELTTISDFTLIPLNKLTELDKKRF